MENFPIFFRNKVEEVFYRFELALEKYNNLKKSDNNSDINFVFKIYLFEAYILREYKNYIKYLISVGKLEDNDSSRNEIEICSKILKSSIIEPQVFYRKKTIFRDMYISPHLKDIYEWIVKKIELNPNYVLSTIEINALESAIKLLESGLDGHYIPFECVRPHIPFGIRERVVKKGFMVDYYVSVYTPIIEISINKNLGHMSPHEPSIRELRLRENIKYIEIYIEKIKKVLDFYQNNNSRMISLNNKKKTL